MQAELTRTVRFCLAPDGSLDGDAPTGNSFAAWPPMRGLGRYYEIHVTCRGEVNRQTGYLADIRAIDRAVRERGLPVVSAAARAGEARPGAVVRRVFDAVAPELDCPVVRLGLQLTPTYGVTIEAADMAKVQITQQYEFSAAHRLHVPELSEDENRRIFGKCNNPSGHGHNYRFEVTVGCDEDQTPDVGALDEVVDRTVVDRYDHKHLNADVPEFSETIPSVEHIARAIYDLLAPAVREINVELDQVRVWETGKTACTYAGPSE